MENSRKIKVLQYTCSILSLSLPVDQASYKD